MILKKKPTLLGGKGRAVIHAQASDMERINQILFGDNVILLGGEKGSIPHTGVAPCAMSR